MQGGCIRRELSNALSKIVQAVYASTLIAQRGSTYGKPVCRTEVG